MSDIPEARRLIAAGLRLMTREKPAFRHKPELRALTRAERIKARKMRAKGWSLNRIERALDTNIGRVSEVVNGKKKKRRKAK